VPARRCGRILVRAIESRQRRSLGRQLSSLSLYEIISGLGARLDAE
jgi:hypothetical protein